jgi:hypothetical protein
VGETAADVYSLRVRLGRFLPTWLVVPLALARNFLVGLIPPWTFGPGQVAPQWVLVIRKADAAVVGRVLAGRDFGDGENLLAAMSRSLDELTPSEFLDTWHTTRV